MRKRLDTVMNEPAAPRAGGPQPRDWVLVGVVVIVALAEGILDPSLTWRALSVAIVIGFAFTLPWRRVAPLRAVTLSFGATGIAHAAAILAGVPWMGLDANGFMLILPYALLRWASGRDAAIGIAVIAASFACAMWVNVETWGEILGASLFLLFPAALGAAARYRSSAERRAIDQARMREREQLARELHDSVAHHVSAIAVQAQAGRALAASQPSAPVEALAVIEDAASRTLADMRRIVAALRSDGDEAPLTPGSTLEDIRGLAGSTADGLMVVVEVTPALDDLDAGLQATLYRLAQEAVTNATRHARGATRVSVRLTPDAHGVRLAVVDDGRRVRSTWQPGFGLRGMRERVTLLGGQFHAGPGPSGGWSIDAVVPRRTNDR